MPPSHLDSRHPPAAYAGVATGEVGGVGLATRVGVDVREVVGAAAPSVSAAGMYTHRKPT
jgi:hypothetical protein